MGCTAPLGVLSLLLAMASWIFQPPIYTAAVLLCVQCVLSLGGVCVFVMLLL